MSADTRWQAVVASLEERFWLVREASRIGQEAGLSSEQRQALGIVAAELASNAIKYAGGGLVTVSLCNQPGEPPEVVLEIEDHGPGIAGLADALKDGVSQGRLLTPDTPPGERRGLGVGLGAVLRLADDVTFFTKEHQGTKVRAVFRVKRRAPKPP